MTEGMLIVSGVLVAAVALFAWGRPRSDVVAILVVLALNLSGVLTIQESLAGFGDPVVMLIAAVAIVGEGLVATGVAYRLGEAVRRAGGSNEARLMALVMALAGSVGAFMSSSAIVAMFIPVVMAIANRSGLNPKRMLMPLSVAALISGMMTLIASSPNLIVENTLRARGLARLGFFSWTPFGVAVLAAAIVFMLVFGRNMLSKRLIADDTGPGQPSAVDLVSSYGLADKWHRFPRCSRSTGSALFLSASRGISTGDNDFYRRCPRPCLNPMTRSSRCVPKNRPSRWSRRRDWWYCRDWTSGSVTRRFRNWVSPKSCWYRSLT